MLSTGVEVEARPPGKKVKRLSLLSGGERSLVAVAFLVSLFKARPSPFYILDEVEAALDDTNLGRLLEIYEELRESSQLLVITHQKRTMEVGDALYGVTMRGDGVSTVISQRLREQSRPEPRRPTPPPMAGRTSCLWHGGFGHAPTRRDFPVLLIVISMLVILVLAALVLVYAAFPHRGETVPGASWLGDALEKAADAAPLIEPSDEQAWSPRL